MAKRFSLYKMQPGDNAGDPETWDKRFEDVDNRLHARELDGQKIDETIAALQAVALQRLNDTFTPLIQEAQQALQNQGVRFAAESLTEETVGLGEKSFSLTIETARTWVESDYVTIRHDDAVMAAQVLEFDRSNRLLVVDVLRTIGSGTYAEWVIRPNAAPDVEHETRIDNPHGTTAAQVGAYTVDEADDAIDDAVSTAIAAEELARNGAIAAAVNAAVNGLTAGAATALDTLGELAAALGSDPNFATTVTNALAAKAPLASPALTGAPTAPTAAAGTETAQLATTAYVRAEVRGFAGQFGLGATGLVTAASWLAGEPGSCFDFLGQTAMVNDRDGALSNCGRPHDLLTFTRSSSGLYMGQNRLLASAGNNVLRYDFDGVTGNPRGALIEGGGVEMLQKTEDFSNALWSKQGTSAVTANAALAPDGTMTADRLTGNNGYNNRIAQGPLAVSGSTTYCVSLWIRSNGSGSGFRVQLATAGGTYKTETSPLFAASASEWTRVSMSFATNADNTGLYVILYCDGHGSMDVWGANCKAGVAPTSYTPRDTSAVTRADDRLESLLSQLPFSATEGTLFVEYSIDRVSTVNTWVVELSDGSNNERVISYVTTGNLCRAFVGTGNVGQLDANSSASSLAAGSIRRHAISWRADDFAHALNGGAVVTDTAGSIPAVTKVAFGKTWSNNSHLNGHLRRVVLLPRALPHALLPRITALAA